MLVIDWIAQKNYFHVTTTQISFNKTSFKFKWNFKFPPQNRHMTKTSKCWVTHSYHWKSTWYNFNITWNINQDKLTLKLVTKDYLNTKRGILSLVSSVYNPFGILTPSLLEPNLILQELWKLKISWDKQVSKELEVWWIVWKKRDGKHISSSKADLGLLQHPRWRALWYS